MRRGDPPAQGSPQPRQPPQPVSQAMTDGYRLARDADLTTRNTFGVPARAPLLAEVDDAAALPQLFADGIVDVADPALLVLGGGSNLLFDGDAPRMEERRVGKECRRTFRSRGSHAHIKKNL